MPSLRVAGRRKKREPKDAKVDRMLQDYLRYMDDFDVSRPLRAGDTDPAPAPDGMGTLPPSKRPTLPEGPPEESEDAEERRLEREEIEKARIKSDVRAKRERKTTVKSKKSQPR
jgi:hypothetical protein